MLVSKRSSRELLGNVGDLRGSDRGGGGKEGGKSDDRHCHEIGGSTSMGWRTSDATTRTKRLDVSRG